MRLGTSLCNKLITMFYLFFLSAVSFIGISGASSDKSDSSSDFRFPEIKGWKKQGEIQVFKPENLYEYIDGAAELYLSYDFQQLYAAEYIGPKGESVVVEIYYHKTPYSSFGIYSQERPTGGDFLTIGTQGYIEPPVLNFIKGNAYVKLNSYKLKNNELETLKTFAANIADKLDGTASLPSILNCFPRQGKIPNSEKYVNVSFLGFDFLHNAFTADYSVQGDSFQLFIIEGTSRQDSEEMLKSYLLLAKEKTTGIKEGTYLINDPYHKKVTLVWKGRYLCGALNIQDEKTRAEYLRLIEQLLDKQLSE